MSIDATVKTPSEVAIVTRFFSDVLESLSQWTDSLAEELLTARHRPLTSTRLDALVEPYARASFFEARLPVYGAGFVAAPDLLSDARGHLSWWQGPGHAKLSLASPVVNKEHLDYTELEWYRTPLLSGRPHIAGPYVDYLCSDEYTVTAAAPIIAHDAFMGVSAIDLLVESIEDLLLPRLSRSPARVTIVNSIDRVVVSTDAALATGDSLRGHAPGRAGQRHECAGLPLAVLIG